MDLRKNGNVEMRNSGKRDGDDFGAKRKLKDDVDELFKLPLADFIGARNALAAQLKKSGQANDASLVKSLAKPSVSAWAVNQLYWHQRAAFDKLLAAGQRLRGKVTDMRGALDARREALLHLADLATSLLSDAGHNPSPDTIRRVTTTLEALSALSDGPTLGRLTQDVDPPGFESLTSFSLSAGALKPVKEPARVTALQAAREEETRQAKIATAKASLQAAKKTLADANAEARQADKQLREAEEQFKQAKAEAAEAARTVENAKRSVEKASKELESLFSTN
jgi:hypothetical protein